MRSIALTLMISTAVVIMLNYMQGCSHKMLLKGTNCNETIVEQLLICDEVAIYCILGKLGGVKVWQIDSFRAFGERKFGELINHQPID